MCCDDVELGRPEPGVTVSPDVGTAPVTMRLWTNPRVQIALLWDLPKFRRSHAPTIGVPVQTSTQVPLNKAIWGMLTLWLVM